MSQPHKLPRFLTASLAAAALFSAAVFAAGPAYAETTESGPEGQELTVSTTELDPEETTVAVSGSGFREDVGIYVALCVVPEEGEAPGPCLGGVNTTGESESSLWIASEPPAYAEGLTIPYGEGGTFDEEITVSADDGHTDCLDESVAPNGCAISTRADHTRDGDRSADILIPVTFDGAADSDGEHAGEPEDADDGAEEPDGPATPETQEPDAGADETPEDANEADEGAATDAANDTADAEDGSPTGWIIFGAVVLLGAIAGAAAVAAANRKKRQAEAPEHESGSEDPGAGTASNDSPNGDAQ